MELPFYVEEMRVKGETTFLVRPLFVPRIERRGELLSRAMSRVVQDVREAFAKAGESPRHDQVLAWSFAPDLASEELHATLLLRHATVQCHLLVVCFKAFDFSGKTTDTGRVAFSPSLPNFWFDVGPGDTLANRAKAAFTEYFKALEKEEGAHFKPPSFESFVRGWVTTADFSFSPAQKYQKPVSLFAALSGQEKMSGAQELQRVGRRLDALYPDELDRAVMREAEVAELSRLLADDDRRPILLVGPPQVGKTAILHEYIYRRRQVLSQVAEYRGSLWLISPQRLISGMMYAGQWENRLLAILDHLKETSQVLYLDDLPGLYHAGISAQSRLSVAEVLRPYIERRDVRVVAEITPEARRALQERDRGFADLFHVIPVREPPLPEMRRVLFSVVRALELAHGTRFHVDALPTLVELQSRYVRDLAFPGKAALFLRDLAAKYPRVAVDRAEVLAEFHAKSGLSLGFLDRRAKLERAAVEKSLRESLIGQEAAVQGMADAVSIAKAQLNDPGRPLGSFLFVGPTGVGKTQAAKALATYLFGNADRLLRFDMNEYLDAYSAQRLVGTWGQPEGLLTSAVRRMPFSVILLDEIEKTDPSVFDILLQVLGEGRLTDSLGRTADFANTIIIMTSNLGVREAESSFGFSSATSSDRAAHFRRAAQAFFRPEFFNRIDRIVPFEKLTREHTQAIASDLIADVLSREGLQQRRCMLAVASAAMERIVDAGFHPELGARALKRAIERQLTHPVAARLAAIEPGTPTLIDVIEQGEEIAVRVQAMPYAQRLAEPDVSDPPTVIERIDAALDAQHEALQRLRPAGRLTVGDIAPQHVRYYALKEQFDKLEHLLERFEQAAKAPRKPAAAPHGKPFRPGAESLKRARVNHRALLAAHDLRQYLHDCAQDAQEATHDRTEHLQTILRELALLHAMARSQRGRLLLLIRMPGGAGRRGFAHTAPVFRFFTRVGWTVTDLAPSLRGRAKESPQAHALLVDHPAADVLAQTERGVHLVIGPAQELYPVEVATVLLEDGDDPAARARDVLLEKNTGEIAGNVLRLFDRDVLDLRTGLICPTTDPSAKPAKSAGSSRAHHAMVFGAMPLPEGIEV